MKSVLSISSLLDWLETQDPSKTYIYGNPKCCLAARYCQAHNIDYWPVSIYDPAIKKDFLYTLEVISHYTPCTYGDALTRTRNVDATLLRVSS